MDKDKESKQTEFDKKDMKKFDSNVIELHDIKEKQSMKDIFNEENRDRLTDRVKPFKEQSIENMIREVNVKAKASKQINISVWDVAYSRMFYCKCFKERPRSSLAAECETVIGNLLDAPQIVRLFLDLENIKRFLFTKNEEEMMKYPSINVDEPNRYLKYFKRLEPREDHPSLSDENDALNIENLRYILRLDLTKRTNRLLLTNYLKSYF